MISFDPVCEMTLKALGGRTVISGLHGHFGVAIARESAIGKAINAGGFVVAQSLRPLCISADEIVHDLVDREWRRSDGRRERAGIGVGRSAPASVATSTKESLIEGQVWIELCIEPCIELKNCSACIIRRRA